MQLPTRSDIEAAAAIVARHFAPTPQFAWPLLRDALGTDVWVKHQLIEGGEQ